MWWAERTSPVARSVMRTWWSSAPMASFRHALTEAPQRQTRPHWDRPVNSEPRPCLFSVGFPLSGPQVRTSTSDLIRHALRTCGVALRAPPPRRPPASSAAHGVTYVSTHERPITWDICPEPRHLRLRLTGASLSSLNLPGCSGLSNTATTRINSATPAARSFPAQEGVIEEGDHASFVLSWMAVDGSSV